MALCNICPRECGVDRSVSKGFCGEGNEIRVAKIMLHHWEEPCVSGGENGNGSGAIFFSGCSLKCVYCQNREISHGGIGEIMSTDKLAEAILDLQSKGAYNINFVTPTHFTSQIIDVLDSVKDKLNVPVVWNTSGYEKAETVRLLAPYVDVFLTDFKYCSDQLASDYSSAPNYKTVAEKALAEMFRVVGKPVFSDGFIKKGIILRHLVLPGAYKDSIEVLNTVEKTVGHENAVLSLMAQYTPEFLTGDHHALSRRITTFEYEKVVSHAISLGFDGYIQSKESATSKYTPSFK